MFPYIFIILVLFIGAFVEITIANKRNIKILFIIESLLITLFVGLRFHTGADWSAYEYAFYNMPSLGNYPHWEYGYYILNLICYKLLGNYYVFQFLASCFVVYSASRFFWKHSEYPLSCLLLFFLTFTPNGILMCQVRQSIAIGIIAFGAKYILNRSFIKFLIVVYIASLFHISSIAAIPLYLCTIKFPKSILTIAVILSQIFYFVPNLIAKFIKILIPIFPSRLAEIAQSYLDSVFFSGTVSFGTGLYYIFTVIIGIIIILFINRRNEADNLYVNALVISMIISAISNSFTILSRFEPIYLLFAVLSYTLIFNQKIKHIKRSVVPTIAIVMLSIFHYIPFNALITSTSISKLTGRADNYGWTPYYNVILHPKEAEERLDWNE